MTTHQCDICKNKINFSEFTDIHVNLHRYEFCNDCGKPLLKFLKKHKLIKKDEGK